VPPLVIERETGKTQAVTKERGGGSFALLADDRQLLFGPGNRQVSITQIDMPLKEKPGKPVQFPGAAAVVEGGVIYVLTASKLSALDRSDRKPRWTAPCEYGSALILAGGTLVTGGQGGVAAFRAADGQRLWDAALEGNACGLTVAHDALVVSTDDGAIHCFRPGSEKAVGRPHAQRDTSPPSSEPLLDQHSLIFLAGASSGPALSTLARSLQTKRGQLVLVQCFAASLFQFSLLQLQSLLSEPHVRISSHEEHLLSVPRARSSRPRRRPPPARTGSPWRTWATSRPGRE